jgi:hypothetical protein
MKMDGPLGCIASLTFLVLAERYGAIANRTAGVGIIFGIAHLMLAAALCLLGVLFGVVALIRIHNNKYRGLGIAWAGIVFGSLPLVIELVSFLLSDADSNPLRR